jgi:cellobiose-specific phosphotransferase system component IIB
MERLDRMQDALTEIRDDITVNITRAERAHDAADTTRADARLLGEQVSAMYRQLKRLEARVRDMKGDP